MWKTKARARVSGATDHGIRIDPATKRSAVGHSPAICGKIPVTNAAHQRRVRRRPAVADRTIKAEFDLNIDHFIQIDFCAFQRLVKAVGGVSVPLPYPVRDGTIGLEVLTAGCHSFNGDEALKYVRSRHFEYQDDKGKWHEDPSSDLGRIARQQDFLRRTLSAALKQNILRPKIITSLYASYRDDLVIDTGLTIDKMIEFVGVIKKVTPSGIRNYQIEATGKTINGNAVLIWHKDSENMQAILNIFRGLAPLADAPEQKFEDTTTTSTLPHTTTVESTGSSVAMYDSPTPPLWRQLGPCHCRCPRAQSCRTQTRNADQRSSTVISPRRSASGRHRRNRARSRSRISVPPRSLSGAITTNPQRSGRPEHVAVDIRPQS